MRPRELLAYVVARLPVPPLVVLVVVFLPLLLERQYFFEKVDDSFRKIRSAVPLFEKRVWPFEDA